MAEQIPFEWFFSVIPERIQTSRWNVSEKKAIPFEMSLFWLLLEFPEISVPFVHSLLEWFALPATMLLSYIEGKHCGRWLLALLTKCGCCSRQKSYRKFHSNGKRSYVSIFKFINQGHEKNNGNFPNISLLSRQVSRRCLEKCRLTLFFSFPCFHRPNLDEELELEKSDLTWP